MRIRSLIHEVHRRSLWQVLAIYVLGAWAAYEMIDAVTDRLGLPGWVPGIAIVLFLIGLPIVIATAFVQEGLPGQDGGAKVGPYDPTLVPGLERSTSPLTPAVPHSFLTWQRAVLSGIVAFLLLGLTAGGYIGLRNAGVGPFASLITSGAMSSQDRVVIAQLDHASGDSATAAAITEALRVDLAQSHVVDVVATAFIGDALQRMGRPRDAHLDPELAREVAIREGAKAVLVGDIAPVGSGWVITARLLNASTGEELYSRRENARNADEMIPAVDRMSHKLREAIGESLKTVRAGAPLEAVTTSSLAALQKYTQGVYAHDIERDYDRAIQLLDEAVEVDSTFAMAWRLLSVVHSNSASGDRLVRHAATRAYELRDRLPDRERYHAIAWYNMFATRDVQATIAAYRSLLDAYPNDYAALNNIATNYNRVRDTERAIEFLRRSIAADSFKASSWANLVNAEYARGQHDEARALIEQIRQRFPLQQRENDLLDTRFAAAEGRYDEADQIMRDVLTRSRGSSVWQQRANFALSSLSLVRGRAGEARQYLGAAIAAFETRGTLQARVVNERFYAQLDGIVYGRPDRALERLNALIEQPEWRAANLIEREQLFVAHEFARMGSVATARRLVSEWDAAPPDARGDSLWTRESVNGWIALGENRPADAVAAFHRAAAWGGCETCNYPEVANAFAAAGMADSAIAYRRKYIDMPNMTRMGLDGFEVPISYERLAELYDARGDIANAREYAGRFIELWKDADPELQPRVRRMQALLARNMER